MKEGKLTKRKPLQEPHPVRLSQEEVEKRKAQLDSSPLSMFEHLSDLKSFFVEVSLKNLHVLILSALTP